MTSTGCFFNVNKIMSFFRVGQGIQRHKKIIKKKGGKSKNNLKTRERTTATVPSKTKDGKVRKKTCKKEQDKVLCDPAKLGKGDF